MAVLRKVHSHSVLIRRMIRINNVKEDRRKKTNSNFNFSQAQFSRGLIFVDIVEFSPIRENMSSKKILNFSIRENKSTRNL